MTILHTKFLVHWTGKDFHMPITALDDNIRTKYIIRLIDILKDGFYMRRNTEREERIYGPEGSWIQATISRTCFTKIKLSLAKKHAQTYGNLGIGVDRKYVIERYGNPVFYITNGDYSNIVVCARKVHDFLEKHNSDMFMEFGTLLSYFKKMSEQNSEDLTYYDELEWRITHLNQPELQRYLTTQDKNNYIYRINLSKQDVKVIIFPDEEIKNMALKNRDILALIDKPICVTIDDCENF